MDQGGETKTSIDSLLELLRQNGKLELTSIASMLGIGTAILEQWAKVLENGKLIRVSYELGKMYLEPAVGTAEQQEAQTTKTEAQRFTLENDVELQKVTLERFYKNLETLTGTVNNLNVLYRQRLPSLHVMLDELDKLSAPMDMKIRNLNALRQNSDTYLTDLDKRIDKIYAKLGVVESIDVQSKLKAEQDALESAKQKAEGAQVAMKALDDTKKEFLQALNDELEKRTQDFKKTMKKSVDGIYDQVKSEQTSVAPLIKSIKEDTVNAASMVQEAQALKVESDEIARVLVAARSSFKDRYQKSVDDINSTTRLFEQKYALMKREIEMMRVAVGNPAAMYNFLKSVKDDLKEIGTMIADDKRDVDVLIQELRVVSNAKELGADTRTQAIDAIKRRASETREKSRKIENALQNASEKLRSQRVDGDKK